MRQAMKPEKFAAVILAAGKGTRMKSDLPKVMHRLANRPMIQHVLETVRTLEPARTVVVLAPEMDRVAVAAKPAAVAVLAMRPAVPGGYGRMVTGSDGSLEAIVEAKDASAAQREIALCNAGVMAIDATLLFDLLAGIGTNNAQGEYYLTDIVAIARARGRACRFAEAGEEETLG